MGLQELLEGRHALREARSVPDALGDALDLVARPEHVEGDVGAEQLVQRRREEGGSPAFVERRQDHAAPGRGLHAADRVAHPGKGRVRERIAVPFSSSSPSRRSGTQHDPGIRHQDARRLLLRLHHGEPPYERASRSPGSTLLTRMTEFVQAGPPGGP
jgi:hypothetical protein